jgi:quercetin dioxygenase-like cupin family protein
VGGSVESGPGAFSQLADLRPLEIWDGILARTVDGDGLTLAVVELAPGALVAEHAHENAQLGLVIRGSVEFRIGDEVRELGPGGTWRIPPDVPHEVTAGTDGAVVVDVFAPAREDWKALDRAELRSPRWP